MGGILVEHILDDSVATRVNVLIVATLRCVLCRLVSAKGNIAIPALFTTCGISLSIERKTLTTTDRIGKESTAREEHPPQHTAQCLSAKLVTLGHPTKRIPCVVSE